MAQTEYTFIINRDGRIVLDRKDVRIRVRPTGIILPGDAISPDIKQAPDNKRIPLAPCCCVEEELPFRCSCCNRQTTPTSWLVTLGALSDAPNPLCEEGACPEIHPGPYLCESYVWTRNPNTGISTCTWEFIGPEEFLCDGCHLVFIHIGLTCIRTIGNPNTLIYPIGQVNFQIAMGHTFDDVELNPNDCEGGTRHPWTDIENDDGNRFNNPDCPLASNLSLCIPSINCRDPMIRNISIAPEEDNPPATNMCTADTAARIEARPPFF